MLAKLDLGHLVEGKLDGGLAAEDGDHDLDLARVGHDLGNRAVDSARGPWVTFTDWPTSRFVEVFFGASRLVRF